MTTTRTVDLWHAAGRAARDDRKRLFALQGVLWSAPVLLLGSFAVQLVGDGPAFRGLRHPLAYVLAPLRGAYEADADLAVLGYLAWQGVCLSLVWGYFGGVLYRLAAVDLALGTKEDAGAASAFARRHWRGLVGARHAIWLAAALPLGAGVGLSLVGRLPGPWGGALLAVAVVLVAGLALVAVVVATLDAAAGFLTGPTVAAEDSDAFDAVSRTFTYAAAGLPRLVGWRLLFLSGVLLGSTWRLLRTVLVIALAWACLRIGAGASAVERISAILGAMGMPADADRLGVGPADFVAAAAVALVFTGLGSLWLADLVSRIVCARTAVYLLLRRAIDGADVDVLRTAPSRGGSVDAEAAGFVEVNRVGRD